MMFGDDSLQDILELNTDVLDPARRPTLEELRLLLKACFKASLQTEEGRPTRFNVAFVEPSGPGFPQEETHQWWLLRFERPRDLTGTEFAKLAQACDLRSAYIGVSRAAEAPDQLVIWGILVVGDSTQKMRTGRTVSSSQVGGFYLTVEVIGPGSFLVGNGVRFKRLIGDEVQDEHAENLVALCCTPSSVFRRDYMGEHWTRTVSQILQLIVLAGHGGALFILDGDINTALLDVKYRLQPPTAILKDAVLSVQTADHAYKEAMAKMCLGPSLGADQEIDDADATVASKGRDWDAAIDCVSRLALVDGAVLLGCNFDVMGFGAVVRQIGALDGVLVENVADIAASNRHRYDVSSRGTRHRSAVAFCSQNPGAVAFIVSHDGGISAMRRINDAVLVWGIKPPALSVSTG